MQINWAAVTDTMPATRLRRSWFVKQILVDGEFSDDAEFFVEFYRQLSPSGARTLRARNAPPSDYFLATIAYCKERFPLNDLWAMEMLEEGTVLGEIPVETFGFDAYEDYIDSPAIALCIAAAHHSKSEIDGHTDYLGVHDFECLHPFFKVDVYIGRPKMKPAHLRPFAGYAWRTPWDGLRDLYRWANGETGYNFLDCSESLLGEAYAYPSWGIDEVRALEASWRGAKPVFERANALRNLIDSQPWKWLYVLEQALNGYPPREIMRKK